MVDGIKVEVDADKVTLKQETVNGIALVEPISISMPVTKLIEITCKILLKSIGSTP